MKRLGEENASVHLDKNNRVFAPFVIRLAAMTRR